MKVRIRCLFYWNSEIFFTNYARDNVNMRFEVNYAKLHYRVISEVLVGVGEKGENNSKQKQTSIIITTTIIRYVPLIQNPSSYKALRVLIPENSKISERN